MGTEPQSQEDYVASHIGQVTVEATGTAEHPAELTDEQRAHLGLPTSNEEER